MIGVLLLNKMEVKYERKWGVENHVVNKSFHASSTSVPVSSAKSLVCGPFSKFPNVCVEHFETNLNEDLLNNIDTAEAKDIASFFFLNQAISPFWGRSSHSPLALLSAEFRMEDFELLVKENEDSAEDEVDDVKSLSVFRYLSLNQKVKAEKKLQKSRNMKNQRTMVFLESSDDFFDG